MPKLPMRNQRVPAKDRRRAPPPPKKAEPFYGSAEWQEVRERLKAQRGERCETCGNRGRVILHHIVERKDGGAPFAPSNLIFQCDPCHGKVTAANRSLRADGKEPKHGPQESPPSAPAPRSIRLG